MPSPQHDDPLDHDQDMDMDRQPLDPFPTLLSSLRTHIAQPAMPTYAAIARSPSNSTRPTLAPEIPLAGPATTWSADDIDRDDRLDEIRSFPSSPVVFRVSPPPQPQPVAGPSSSTAAPVGENNGGVEAGIDALPVRTRIDAAPVPGSVLSPLSAHRSTPRRMVVPTIDDGSFDEIMGSMPPVQTRLARPRTVAPNPPVDPIGEAMATVFGGTWDEGMVAAARHLTQPVDGTTTPNLNQNRDPGPLEARTIPLLRRQQRDRNPVDPAQAQDNRTMDERVAEIVQMRNDLRTMRVREEAAAAERDRILDRARERIAATARGLNLPTLGNNRYGQDQEEGNGEGDLDVEADPYEFRDRPMRLIREQLEADMSDDDEGSPDIDIETEAEYNERAMLERVRQDAEAIANARNELDTAGGRPPRGAARARLMQSARGITAPLFPNTFNSLSIENNLGRLGGAPTGAGTGTAPGPGPGPDGVGRTVRPFYAHPNITGDIDIDAWETAFGDDPPPLRRGGNNRRRGTVTRPQSSHLPRVHGATETRDVRPLSREQAGLLPTNRYSHASNFEDVTVVTSRPRDEVEEDIQSGDDATQPKKKRRFSVKAMTCGEPPQKYPTQGEWPTYLEHNPYIKNQASDFLPLKFESTNETFLKVTQSSIGRPIVQFIDHPQLTSTDTDASNIGTTSAIPVGLGIFYYEVECISDGIEGFMSVGWKLGGIRKNRLIGWDKGTFGWHSDDGMCFEQSGSGSAFAAKWGRKSV
jgi:hypothetical protein